MVVEKNKNDWNNYAEKWDQLFHAEPILRPILSHPEKAFHKTIWELFQRYLPDFHGKKICVPSSGDNHAVFAFALLGAEVTSCDISEKQLEYAQKIAEREGIDQSIRFVCTDTMTLENIDNSEYDLVYTSNGVHVWLNDLSAMYRNIYRVLKPGGLNILYDIHPFMRPFDDHVKMIKPYDNIGPFEDEYTVNFHWRVQDILNAILDSGIQLVHIEEVHDEKNYDHPFWVKAEEILQGVKFSKDEVDRMYDWRMNPSIGLPNWLCVIGRKPIYP